MPHLSFTSSLQTLECLIDCSSMHPNPYSVLLSWNQDYGLLWLQFLGDWMPQKSDRCNSSIRGSIHVMQLQNQKKEIPVIYAHVIQNLTSCEMHLNLHQLGEGNIKWLSVSLTMNFPYRKPSYSAFAMSDIALTAGQGGSSSSSRLIC
jgi:hypothetical protein